VIFYVAIAWLAVLLGVVVVRLARARSTGERILALDLLTLVLVGLLAIAAGEDQRSYALDAALALALLSFVATLAASRYYESRRPFS
jgi:multicomponent Na+:H+ antiporter subunit F